jgi:GTP-binding protein HflX
VGFIRNLPTTLVKAFRATLEEVREAELLLHVVDASAPNAAEHYAHVIEVLKEIESDETPQIVVLNKVDALGDLAPEFKLNPAALAGRVVGDATLPAAIISARTGEGMHSLLELLDQRLSLDPVSPATFRFPVGEGSILHILHERSRVNSTEFGEEFCTVVADAPQSVQRQLQKYIVPKDFGYSA